MREKKILKIVVLGSRGMLGQMAVRYFHDCSYEVIAVPMRYELGNRQELMSAISEHPGAVIINAIGKIKQKSEAVDDLLWANAVLPLDLANTLREDQFLVHASTDCVFSGVDGRAYVPTDVPNANDDYGWSKRLGEIALLSRPNTLILRVSIIGPDDSSDPKGLLGWFLSRPNGSKLRGFTNHYWNGITTLEWCKQVDACLVKMYGNNDPCRLLQLGTEETYSKYEMLRLFQEIYETGYDISTFKTAQSIDRRLVPEIYCRSLKDQLLDIRSFIRNGIQTQNERRISQ